MSVRFSVAEVGLRDDYLFNQNNIQMILIMKIVCYRKIFLWAAICLTGLRCDLFFAFIAPSVCLLCLFIDASVSKTMTVYLSMCACGCLVHYVRQRARKRPIAVRTAWVVEEAWYFIDKYKIPQVRFSISTVQWIIDSGDGFMVLYSVDIRFERLDMPFPPQKYSSLCVSIGL